MPEIQIDDTTFNKLKEIQDRIRKETNLVYSLGYLIKLAVRHYSTCVLNSENKSG